MFQNKLNQVQNLKKYYDQNPGEVARIVKKYNIVLNENLDFIPRPCEYYLHFNANLPYPDNVNLSNQEYK